MYMIPFTIKIRFNFFSRTFSARRLLKTISLSYTDEINCENVASFRLLKFGADIRMYSFICNNHVALKTLNWYSSSARVYKTTREIVKSQSTKPVRVLIDNNKTFTFEVLTIDR